MALVLTRDELVELTGTKQPKRMTAWLEERGWVYETSARRGDVPKVAHVYYESRMTGRRLPHEPRRAAPRLDFFADA